MSNHTAEYRHMLYDDAWVRPAIDWLNRNDHDPSQLVTESMDALQKRGRYLPPQRRDRYARRVLLATFFAEWAKKHTGKNIREIAKTDAEFDIEVRPFQFAMMAAGDAAAFHRETRGMARKRMAGQLGMDLGNPSDFEGFVAARTEYFADIFLAKFDTTRPDLPQKAIRYLQKTAVSSYLVRRTRPIRKDAPNLAYYLKTTRASKRTILAVKLAYLPLLLTGPEKKILRDQYGLSGGFRQHMKIKDIAKALGYKNPATLSNKLYKVRAWCRSSVPDEVKEGPDGQVDYE